MNKLLVNEIFGPTIQGEGPATGRRCAFVRLAICPLRCRWCDTWYTWSFTDALSEHHDDGLIANREDEIHPMSVGAATQETLSRSEGSRLVIISGGEPLAQVPPRLQGRMDLSLSDCHEDLVGGLIQALSHCGIEVHIETAGIRAPSSLVHSYVSQYVVSPKLDSSGNDKRNRYRPEILDFFAKSSKAVFKFVITNADDLAEVNHIVARHHIPASQVWLMPEGTEAEAIMLGTKDIAPIALRHGYNVSTRLHVLIWGNKRGY